MNNLEKREIDKQSNFYMENDTCINERIKEEKTIVFLSQKEAITYAKKIKSYHYPLYIKQRKDKVRKLHGYAVPK